MTGRCAWKGCDRPGVLAVLVGPDPNDAERDGDYCVPHAALTGGDRRDEQDQPVWVDMANASTHAWAIALDPQPARRTPSPRPPLDVYS